MGVIARPKGSGANILELPLIDLCFDCAGGHCVSTIRTVYTRQGAFAEGYMQLITPENSGPDTACPTPSGSKRAVLKAVSLTAQCQSYRALDLVNLNRQDATHLCIC